MNLLSSWRKRFFNCFSPQNRKLKKFNKQHQLDKHLVSSLNKTKFPSAKQLKYLPKILNRKEKIKISLLVFIVAVSGIALLINGYLNATIAIPKAGGEYIEGLVGSPQFINPILAQTNDVDLDLSRLIFSGLLKQDANGQLAPDLAERYEISPDQLTYTFYLRNNVKWHDGSPFKADDVIFTIASLQDPAFKSPLSRSFRGITAEKIDDFTVKFTLKEPFAPFLGLLTFGVLPEHLWFNVPPANADLAELNKRPIGTGSWKFENFKKDKSGIIRSYTLIPNTEYYGQKPYLQKLIFKFYGDFETAIEAIKSKEVDSIAYLPKELSDQLRKYKNIAYHNLNQPQYNAVFFNQKKNEFLAADYVRQALALGTNKQKIVESLGQGAVVIDGPTLPGIGINPDIKKYEYDPQAAVDLLEKNDWHLVATTTPDGITEQIRKKKNWFLTVTLTTVDQPEYIEAAEILKQSWDQIGFKTTLNIVDKSKILQDVINSRSYEALLFGENLGSDPDPFPFWHSSQNEYPGLNLAIFSNSKVDKYLEDARKTNDWEERKNNYLAFQGIIAQELPAIFLYNPTYIYPQDNKIKGFNLTNISIPSDRFADSANWYIKTKRIWK